VFYTALGHFEETWRDARFQQTLLGAMLWLTGQAAGDATPRPAPAPKILADGIANAASFAPRNAISAGSLVTLFGENLTAGAIVAADPHSPLYKLGDTVLKINGAPAPLLYASPKQINAYVPLETRAVLQNSVLEVTPAGGTSIRSTVEAAVITPGVHADCDARGGHVVGHRAGTCGAARPVRLHRRATGGEHRGRSRANHV
jgi:hypothetical protein